MFHTYKLMMLPTICLYPEYGSDNKKYSTVWFITGKNGVKSSEEEWNPDRVFVDAVEGPDRMSGDDQFLPAPLRVDSAKPKFTRILI